VNASFTCLKCERGSQVVGEINTNLEMTSEVVLESVRKFCYFGDTLNAGGSCSKSESFIKKIQELLPILEHMGASVTANCKLCKLYKCCVRSTFAPAK
jgi:hypothetical protein